MATANRQLDVDPIACSCAVPRVSRRCSAPLVHFRPRVGDCRGCSSDSTSGYYHSCHVRLHWGNVAARSATFVDDLTGETIRIIPQQRARCLLTCSCSQVDRNGRILLLAERISLAVRGFSLRLRPCQAPVGVPRYPPGLAEHASQGDLAEAMCQYWSLSPPGPS